MFRGWITEVGIVVDAGERIVVRAPKSASQLEPGGSVCVSGVCLSAHRTGDEGIEASLSPETRRRSTLGDFKSGDEANVELPPRLGDALHGHLVQGHVDAVGKVVRVDDEGIWRRLWVRPPERFLDALVAKGAVAVDGVSLTVAEIVRDRFCVSLVPATLDASTLGRLAPGARVNLESDVVAKLARTSGGDPYAALAAVVGAMPWAGVVTGRAGVDKAVRQIAAGGCVVAWDPEREGEGDVVAAGASLRPETFVFLLTQACGHTTVPCDAQRLDRLEIPAMPGSGDRHGTAPHAPVDLAASIGTGVSPAERAATVRRLASPDARPDDFLRPGHVFPLAARPGLLSERRGHTEASIALCQAAGVATVAAICEVMGLRGAMAGFADLERFALRWGLPMVAIDDLALWL